MTLCAMRREDMACTSHVVLFGEGWGVAGHMNEYAVRVDMNTMRPVQYFPYMANVRLGSGESFESMLRRFGKQVEGDRILAEVRRRRFYLKPSAVRKKKEAVKRRKSSRAPSAR